jgi:HSP20 family protein
MFAFSVAHPARRTLAQHLDRQIDQLLDATRDTVALRSPAIDVSETQDSYQVTLDLPGVAKNEVKIEVEGRRVSIDAQQARTERPEGQAALHTERALTRFSRSFVLPKEVNQADSSAKLENGVLTLTLGKRKAEGNGQVAVS